MTDSDLIHQIRRLQFAANMLNYREFCEALGWEQDEYSLHKFHAFQEFGRLGVFDSGTIETAILAYEAKYGA